MIICFGASGLLFHSATLTGSTYANDIPHISNNIVSEIRCQARAKKEVKEEAVALAKETVADRATGRFMSIPVIFEKEGISTSTTISF